MISNEQNGYFVNKLRDTGYSNASLRNLLQLVRTNGGPGIENVITDAVLANAPDTPGYANNFPSFYQVMANGMLYCGDNPRHPFPLVNIYGRKYNTVSGTRTIVSNISGVGAVWVTYAATSNPFPVFDNQGASFQPVFVVYSPMAPPFDSVILSNEDNGRYISQLVAAGYGDWPVYQVVRDVAFFPMMVKSPFIYQLMDSPSDVAVRATRIKELDLPGQAVAISTDGTVLPVTIYGSSLRGKPGTTTIEAPTQGSANAKLVASSDSKYATSFQANGNTYNVFYLRFSNTDPPSGVPAPSSLILVAAGVLAVVSWQRLRRRSSS